uniref:Glycolipid transfer protein domain containing 2b n=1 Tax=Cyclopterus lumpus TaxID=8103 RepID=A0A8C3B016_CYCLU
MANLNAVKHFRFLSFFVPCQSPSHSHTALPPTVSSTSCTTAVRPMGAKGPLVMEGCPVRPSRCHSCSPHLLAPYLSSWDELVRFMEALGPMVGLISKEIESKTSIIRQLALTETGTKNNQKASQHTGAYYSVRSMIWVELNRGVVDFHHQTDSGCRTLLRLHRALLWLKLFLEKLAETPDAGRLRSPSELCREAYQSTLANHHTWFVRRAAELALLPCQSEVSFFRLVCVQSQEELKTVLNRVVQAIGEVYDRTQKALEENNMLDLP